MAKLIEVVRENHTALLTTRSNIFFIKDGDNWTIEIGLSKKQRDKHEGVYIKPGEVKNYQTKIGMALYIEKKYYGHDNIEDPNGVLAQINWLEMARL